MKLKELYKDGNFVITAHRGASGLEPENTIRSFERAIEIGADVVEFDVRYTKDNELVILHDISLDRTTNGKGLLCDWDWKEAKKLTASHWRGTHDIGEHLDAPFAPEVHIPTLEETLYTLQGRTNLNIQLYAEKPDHLKRICALYDKLNLYESAFLMVTDFNVASQIRAINPLIHISVGESRDNIQLHLENKVDFIQPWRHLLTEDYLKELKASGLLANVFFANSEEEIDFLIRSGVGGALTDRCDIMAERRKVLLGK